MVHINVYQYRQIVVSITQSQTELLDIIVNLTGNKKINRTTADKSDTINNN